MAADSPTADPANPATIKVDPKKFKFKKGGFSRGDKKKR